MPFQLGASQRAANASVLTLATSAIETAPGGSLLIAAEMFRSDLQAFSTVVDAKSNTYTIIGAQQSYSGGTGGARLYYKEGAVGGASHTMTFTNTGTAAAITTLFCEFRGIVPVGAFDTFSQTNDVATPFTTSITPAAGRKLLVALFCGDSGSNPATHAEANGFTIIANLNETNGSTFFTGCLAYQVLDCNGTTAFTCSFTETGGSNTGVFLASFKIQPDAFQAPRMVGGRGPYPTQQFLTNAATAIQQAASGAIAGTDGITFGQTGALTGQGALAGSASLTFAQTGALTGAGALAGSATLTFAQTGALTGAGLLSGTATLTLGQTGTLTGTATLAGNATLTFTATATADAPSGAMTGTATITFGQQGALGGAGALAASTTLQFGQTATLGADGTLAGSSQITFAQTADLKASGALAGSAALTFGQSGDLTAAATGAMSGTATLVFGASATADQPAGVGDGGEFIVIKRRRRRE